MNRVHIVGRKNSGKTTLIVELIEWLSRQGYRVGTVKHTHHNHELDTPGKDSFRHREAGASAVGILSPKMNAVFWPDANNEEERRTETDSRYDLFETIMSPCDLVLVEGDSKTKATKIEVWRQENSAEPMLAQYEGFAAMVTDDEYTTENSIPVLSRSDIPTLANWILRYTGVESREG